MIRVTRYPIILAILILLMFSAAALADGSCGAEVTWREYVCDGDTPMKTVCISGQGRMDDFSTVGQWPWSADAQLIIIEEGVTGIGAYTFAGMTSLVRVEIPDTVSSLGMGAFMGAEVTEGVFIPDSVTDFGGDVFALCDFPLYSGFSAPFAAYAQSEGLLWIPRLTLADTLSESLHYVLPQDMDERHFCYKTVGHDGIKVTDCAAALAYYGGPFTWSVEQISGEQVEVSVEDNTSSLDEDDMARCILWFLSTPSEPGDAVFRITAQCGTASVSGDYTCHFVEPDASVFEGLSISPTQVCVKAGEEFIISCSAPGLAYPPYLNIDRFSSFYSILSMRFSQSEGTFSISQTGDYTMDLSVSLSSNLYYKETISIQVIMDPESGVFGADGDNLTWELDSSGTLTIGGAGAMPDAGFSTDYPWASHTSSHDIRSVVILEGVTNIGDYAFYSLIGLTSVSIAGTVTDIGRCAFMNDYALTELSLPEGLIRIGDSAFRYCGALPQITLPASLTVLAEGAFADCAGLTAFSVAPGSACFSAEDGVLFSADGSVLLAYPCGRSDASYTVPNGVVTVGGYAFSGAARLERVVLPEGLVRIEVSAFQQTPNLNEAALPEGLTEIGYFAFSDSGLTSVLIPASVSTIRHGAFNSGAMTQILVSGDNPFYTSVDGVLFSKDLSVLIEYPSGSSAVRYYIPDSVRSVESYAFSSCQSLKRVMVPTSVKELGIYSFGSYCSLTDIYYAGTEEQWNAISFFYYDDYTFFGISIHYGAAPAVFDLPDSLTEIGSGAFAGLSEEIAIRLPASIAVIAPDAFSPGALLIVPDRAWADWADLNGYEWMME
ncbi:MAG: leucine-rich repeat protein [Clostridia bacterium]|nr:leucine-rich repeat protein [Clostridia bacterium]